MSATAHRIVDLSPLDLQLDPYNPRLSADEEGSSQEELIAIIIERFKIDELAESIISAGYLPFDPLIGCIENGKVIILEGNRRIATLKLLLNPDLAPEKHRKRWKSLSNELPKATRTSIQSVSVQVYPDRHSPELEAYIGFRHVTGVLQWPALEKASFISRLIEEGWSYREIAERLGSYPKTVEKHYVGFRIVEQAKELQVPGADHLAGAFGVLMRALQSPGIQSFLGITYPGDPGLSRAPIPNEQLSNFRDFLEWTFGTEEKNRLLRDSRQLTQWGKILSSEEAVAYLRRSGSPSFERAWFKSGGEGDSLLNSLLQAADNLEESIPLIPFHKDDKAVRSTVERCALFILNILRDFPELKKRHGIMGDV